MSGGELLKAFGRAVSPTTGDEVLVKSGLEQLHLARRVRGVELGETPLLASDSQSKSDSAPLSSSEN